jgi:diguanylate cyclase (GGDEF)-like protein
MSNESTDPHQPDDHSSEVTGQTSAILVVDDEPGNLRLLMRMLTRHGYEVRTALNGEMALQSVAMEAPDLILLDIMMPDMDGYEVCERLKAREATDAIPVIFVSALDDTFDKVRAFNAGGVDYITKPFHLEEVRARIRLHLALRQAQQQLRQQNTQLQDSIHERQRTEHTLRRTITELEHRNHEMHLLNCLSDVLQRAQSLDDVYANSLPLLHDLFPEQGGALYVIEHTSHAFELALTWGNRPILRRQFTLQMCCAFAEHRIYYVGDSDEAQQCPHLNGSTRYPTLCVQLVIRDQPLGILHISNGPVYDEQSREHWVWLAAMVADRLALTISNLFLRDQLRDQSMRDALTGLLNRRSMDDLLDRELNRALRYERPIGIIMADIDHFKRFNDTYGHIAGDAMLRAVGQFFERHIRRDDIACRYGGEEFVLILPEATLAETRQRADTLCNDIRTVQLTYSDAPSETITLSIGVAEVPDHGTTSQMILQAADAALYRAKAEGRNRVAVARLQAPPYLTEN